MKCCYANQTLAHKIVTLTVNKAFKNEMKCYAYAKGHEYAYLLTHIDKKPLLNHVMFWWIKDNDNEDALLCSSGYEKYFSEACDDLNIAHSSFPVIPSMDRYDEFQEKVKDVWRYLSSRRSDSHGQQATSTN